MNEDNIWELGSDSSTYSDYDFQNDSDTITSSMLPIFATSGGKKKPKKNKGKGEAPAPKITSLGGSKTPLQQQRILSESGCTDKGKATEEIPIEIGEELVSKAFISVVEGHFATLYSKIDNLKTEVSTLKTTVVSLVEENKMLGEVGRHAPDPEKQQTMTP